MSQIVDTANATAMNKKLLLLFTGILGLISTQSLHAQTAIMGITEDDKLFTMADATMPGTITTPVAITGLNAGQVVAGADYRPNTGQLYIMGYAAATNTAQLYTLNTATAVATAVGSSCTLLLGTGSIGFDFNPTVDRIRVVGANGKNYRLHPVTGAIAATDLDLNYAAGDINAGQTPSVGAVAYTNSYIGSESTTLFDYDEARNVLVSQVPPNNGTLNTIGLSGILINSSNRSIDMDIYFNAATGTNTAYLSANTLASNNDNLYTVNTATGTATLVGAIGTGIAVKDIATVITRTVPSGVAGTLIYALTRTNRNLISFDSNLPGIIRSLTPVTGLATGFSIVGMDYRPATRTLYALGYSNATTSCLLYTIDPLTGVATAVNTTPVTIVLDSATTGFDFNPTVDRIRVTSGNGNNYRLNPNDGMIAATDSMLAYNIGDVRQGTRPNIGAVAYINSYARATATTLFAIDDSLAAFTSIAPPNNGRVNTIASNIAAFNTLDRTTDLDFYFDSTSMANIGYLALNPAGTNNDNLYTINTTTGVLSAPMLIGYGIPIADIAVVLQYTGPTVGIQAVSRTATVTLFPNPASGMVRVATGTDNGLIDTYTMTDIYGRTVRRSAAKVAARDITLDVSGIAPGTYFINIMTTEKESGVSRFVIR